VSERRWKANPGKSEKPRNRDKRVWIKFRNGVVYREKVKAGDWNWLDRGFDYDIMFFSEED
jgi:hypothetical protein